MSRLIHALSFALLRALIYPMSYLPCSTIHKVGATLGSISYYLLTNYRKRALSNLSLAVDLRLSEKEAKKIAKKSFQNLMITCLEYPKLAKEKDISRIALCENPQKASEILKSGKGVIFLCAHQANWEILFLEGTSRMPGVAIGRPIKNQILYNWVLSIREKFGGKIITPKNAAREGLKALKKGCFLGIVGDQGMPDSGYSSPFLGRRAWSSPLPAILSYRTGAALIVATTRRKGGKYLIRYSEPLYPNMEKPLEEEVDRMMRQSLALLEMSIKENPGQWLWQHNRWKQQTPDRIRRPFRQESICIVLPEERSHFDALCTHLPVLRKIYPREFFTLMVPKGFPSTSLLEDAEVIFYSSLREIFVKDYRFKLVFNFHGNPKIRSHFLSLSAFAVPTLEDLCKAASLPSSCKDFSLLLNKALLGVYAR